MDIFSVHTNMLETIKKFQLYIQHVRAWLLFIFNGKREENESITLG